MCDPIVGAGLAVASAGMQVMQGMAANKAAKQEANNALLTGRQALQAANIEANLKRDASRRELGGIRAIQSASGVDLSSGSAADVGGRQASFGEREAQMKMYEGNLANWQQKYKASSARAAGKAAVMQGIIGAGTTLLTAGTGLGFFGSAAGAGGAGGGTLASQAAAQSKALRFS